MSSLTRSLSENALLKFFSKVLFTSKVLAILMQNEKPMVNLIIKHLNFPCLFFAIAMRNNIEVFLKVRYLDTLLHEIDYSQSES